MRNLIYANTDLMAAVLAAPIFAIAGWPLLGWLVGSLAWLAQRLVQALFAKRVAIEREPRKVAGLMVGSMLLRGWCVAAVVLIAGIVERTVGLSAAILIAAIFSVYFATNMLERLFQSAASEGVKVKP